MKAPQFWHAPRPTLLARAVQPLGAVYGAATLRKLRRARVDCGAPVICVGNYTAGGAGKTPTAIYVAQVLLARGKNLFFLSRGYGGRGGPPLRVDPARHTAADVGDEPLLLARLAPVIVSADRLAGARAAVAQGAGVIVMDDGLQSGGLAHTLALAVIDGGAGFGNGLCVPAGPLRAPVEAQRAHVSAEIVIGAGMTLPAAPGVPRFHGRLLLDAKAAATLKGARVLAFAGIGRPEKFFMTLEEAGAQVVERVGFADHRAYTPRDLAELRTRARDQGLMLTTTEKDAARLPPGWLADSGAHVPAVQLVIDNNDALAAMILAAAGA